MERARLKGDVVMTRRLERIETLWCEVLPYRVQDEVADTIRELNGMVA